MLKKENRLNKVKDIENVLKNGKAFYSDSVGVKTLKNSLDNNRFCIIISAKVSKKSTDRNRIRRQIKFIVLELEPFLKKGFDCLIIIKRDLSLIKFSEIKNLLEYLFKKNGFFSN